MQEIFKVTFPHFVFETVGQGANICVVEHLGAINVGFKCVDRIPFPVGVVFCSSMSSTFLFPVEPCHLILVIQTDCEACSEYPIKYSSEANHKNSTKYFKK